MHGRQPQAYKRETNERIVHKESKNHYITTAATQMQWILQVSAGEGFGCNKIKVLG